MWQALSDNDAPIGKWLRCATSQGDLQTNSALAVTLTTCNGFPSTVIRDTIISDFEDCFDDNGTIRGLYEAYSLFPAATTNATAPSLTTTTTNTVQHLAVIQQQNTTNITNTTQTSGAASGTCTASDTQKAALIGWTGVELQYFNYFFNKHLDGFWDRLLITSNKQAKRLLIKT